MSEIQVHTCSIQFDSFLRALFAFLYVYKAPSSSGELEEPHEERSTNTCAPSGGEARRWEAPPSIESAQGIRVEGAKSTRLGASQHQLVLVLCACARSRLDSQSFELRAERPPRAQRRLLVLVFV